MKFWLEALKLIESFPVRAYPVNVSRLLIVWQREKQNQLRDSRLQTRLIGK